MTQQTSPFIEGKFGWALGESNWNLGMDENLLKFSYLFDRNIDGIVASLPAPVNGQAYFNTTDNRIYYVVNGVFSSTPVPKWFEVTLRSTGEIYRFTGAILEVVKKVGPFVVDENFAYKKKVSTVPYRHPDYATVVGLYGSIYPQSFTIDTVANELLFLSATGAVTVFTWDTKAYVKTYRCIIPFVSENMVIKYSGGVRSLYLRGNNVLAVFNITTVSGFQDLSPSSTIPIIAQRNFAEHADEWLITSNSLTTLGQFQSRGYFGVYDSTFTQVGDVYISPLYAGINESTPYPDLISKLQGMAYDGKNIYFGMGGFWDISSTTERYGAYGVRVFTKAGRLIGDYLLDPSKLLAKLTSLGYSPDHVENEGICYVASEGKMYSLCVGVTSSTPTPISEVEGLYIIEEFCPDTDSVDFSDCATIASTISEDYAKSGILYPKTLAGAGFNPITQTVFVNWFDIIKYMQTVDMSEFRYYSSNFPAITDVNGGAVSAGLLITIRNSNNSTFFVTADGGNLRRVWRVTNTTTITPIQTEEQFRPTLNFVPSVDNSITYGSSSLRVAGSYVVTRFYTATVFDASGTGTPEGVVTAGIGSTFRRTNGGAVTSFYVKESGAGNTGWVAK